MTEKWTPEHVPLLADQEVESIVRERFPKLPTSGIGEGRLISKGEDVVLPLKATDVLARVAGPTCQVSITQTFQNDGSAPLECIYIFPLPGGAVVSGLRFEVGNNVFEGKVKERGQATREYERAREEGYRAALLTEERRNVFTTQVANVHPGETVKVHLTYVEALPFDDGGYVFRFPLTVAPRYIPGAEKPGQPRGEGVSSDTDAVPDASRITPPILLPGVRPAFNLSIQVELATAGLQIKDLASSQHATQVSFEHKMLKIVLSKNDELPNRDFILRWRIGEKTLKSTLFTMYDENDPKAHAPEGTFLAFLVPPSDVRSGEEIPREVLVMLDISGSMDGEKLEAAKQAARILLRGLHSNDAFNVIAFESNFHELWKAPRILTDETLKEADHFIENLQSLGGTELLPALQNAMNREPLAGRNRNVVLITDGQVGNENQILEIATKKNDRIFCIGIDTAVNDAFLRRLATLSGATSTFMTPADKINEEITRFLARVGTPMLVNVEIHKPVKGGLDIIEDSLRPVPIPNLYHGAPIAVLGRFRGSLEGSLIMSGSGPNGTFHKVTVSAKGLDNAALRSLWARETIQTWEDFLNLGIPSKWLGEKRSPQEIEAHLIETSITHQILCSKTAFVVVDQSSDPVKGAKTSTVIPVMLPEGWKHESVFGESRSMGGAGAPPRYLQSVLHAHAPKLARSMDVDMDMEEADGFSDEVMAWMDASVEFDKAEAPPEPALARPRESKSVFKKLKEAVMPAPAQPKGKVSPRVQGESPASKTVDLGDFVLKQRANGSFGGSDGDEIETARALIRLLADGHTDRKGTYRQAVTKAATWLEAQLHHVKDDALPYVVLALVLRAKLLATDSAWDAVKPILPRLAGKSLSPIIQAILHILSSKKLSIPGYTSPSTLDDNALALLLHLSPDQVKILDIHSSL